jgi:hypothetical protein
VHQVLISQNLIKLKEKESPPFGPTGAADSLSTPQSSMVGINSKIAEIKCPMPSKVLFSLDDCLQLLHIITFKFNSRAQKLLKIWDWNPCSRKSKKCLSFFFSFSNSPYKNAYLCL